MSQENFWIPKKHSRKIANEDIAEALGDIPDQSEKTKNQEKVLPGLILTSEFYKHTGFHLEDVYEWYANAIRRRFERKPLVKERFVSHFEEYSTDPTFAFGNSEDGYALGYVRHGIFIPTHFTPKTTRGGYRLMQSLGENTELPVVLSVTEDLQKTLEKMKGWHTVDVGLTSFFRDELQTKLIMYNDHPQVQELMLGLIQDYLAEMGIEFDPNDLNINKDNMYDPKTNVWHELE